MRRVDHASPIHESDSPGEIVFDSDQEIPHSGSSPRLRLPSALQRRRTSASQGFRNKIVHRSFPASLCEVWGVKLSVI